MLRKKRGSRVVYGRSRPTGANDRWGMFAWQGSLSKCRQSHHSQKATAFQNWGRHRRNLWSARATSTSTASTAIVICGEATYLNHLFGLSASDFRADIQKVATRTERLQDFARGCMPAACLFSNQNTYPSSSLHVIAAGTFCSTQVHSLSAFPSDPLACPG